ncbi:restriction endonuclease subunit S [Thiothrix subterranea]|uniref:Restriction endonuclease subunit S n=1 Tax=Thiothrix subterranea TaxID=2735563 RepID=A0AA51MK30_9GAMM|nr:restriction endonuclease subunit S [Thiothrix subterranea]WML85750.1 restriction endonuclease subunit S [Thiothrix subterranea]
MDAKQFLAEFGHIANAPNGVQRLREMIYQLAITGLLSQQVEEAESLLRKIELEREKLIKKNKYKRIPKLEKEILLIPGNVSIPNSWVWTRLLDIGEVSPKNKLDDENGSLADFIPMHSISESHQVALVSEVRRWDEIKKGYTHFANNDVVVAKITPCFENGKAAVIRGLKSELGIGAGTTELHVVRLIHKGVLPNYVYIFLRSPYFKVEGEKNMTGTAGQKRLPTEFFATYPIPLPPTEEQSRIVAKVDELMALCDKLETQQQKKRKLQNKLRQSVLQAVANAESPKELQNSWERLAGNFSYLFAEAEDVAELRILISDMAIKGLLLDENSPDSVKNFVEEVKTIKKSKRFAKLKEAEASFDLPENWSWVLLEDLLLGSDSGWSPQCDSEPRQNDQWGVLKVSAVTWGVFNSGENKKLPLSLEPKAEYEAKPNDFLMSRANTADLVAKSVIVPAGCPERLMMSDKIVRLYFIDHRVKKWVNLVNNSSYARAYYRVRATGTSDSMRNVSRQVIHELSIPLPPIDVQIKIIEKLQALMQFCDTLEVKRSSAQKTAERLATAAIASLTGISTLQQEEPMKVPKTELKAPVRLGTVQPSSNTQAPLASLLARHNGEMGANDLWQRFGGEIDAFYAQLKTEVRHGWIAEPTGAQMLEKEAD